MTAVAQEHGRTTDAIAAAVATSPGLIARVLDSERRRGHVVRDADGSWRATPKLLRKHGRAFRALDGWPHA